jgi:hypothetical protein
VCRMRKKKNLGLSRREFVKITGSSAIAAASGGPFFLFPERAAADQKSLKILQWSHFVPAYDAWFDNTLCKQWGQKHNTNVIVDHINLVDLPAKAASEASARKGHDLFMLLSPPAAYEKQTIDMTPDRNRNSVKNTEWITAHDGSLGFPRCADGLFLYKRTKSIDSIVSFVKPLINGADQFYRGQFPRADSCSEFFGGDVANILANRGHGTKF